MTQNNNNGSDNSSQNQKTKKEQQQSSQRSSSKGKRGSNSSSSSNRTEIESYSDRIAQMVAPNRVVVVVIGIKGGVGKSVTVQQIACSVPPDLLKVIDGDNANQTTKLVVGKMLPVESIEVTENPNEYHSDLAPHQKKIKTSLM